MYAFLIRRVVKLEESHLRICHSFTLYLANCLFLKDFLQLLDKLCMSQRYHSPSQIVPHGLKSIMRKQSKRNIIKKVITYSLQ